MSSSREMCTRNGTRRTSRADVWGAKSGTSRPTCQNTMQNQRVPCQRRLSFRLRCEMRGRNRARRTSRADVWPTKSGTPRPTCQKQYKVNVDPANIDFLLVYGANEMRSKNGARRTSRADVWPNVRWTSRPTQQKTIRSQRSSRQH